MRIFKTYQILWNKLELEMSHLGENKHEQPGKLKNNFTYNRNKVKVNFEI